MKTILATILSAALAGAAFAQVPSLINYQGRLTDANGAAVTGNKNFSISIYDAATAGNLLYTETIGAVTLDDNGVYSFQFGGTGTSNTQVTETIGTTAGSTLTYTKTLSNTPVVANSITVTDGTNSWSQSVGNPGVAATATASRAAGFVIGAEITNGGSGYTSAPLVTITGSGSGATATVTLTDGVVTDITINSAGSGYSGGATITIAPPVIPFRVDYSGGAITATYSTAATAGRNITATYRYGTSGITGALSKGAEHWMAVSVDSVTQGARQRVLAVPFAMNAGAADHASTATTSATVVNGAITAEKLSGTAVTDSLGNGGNVIVAKEERTDLINQGFIEVGLTDVSSVTFGKTATLDLGHTSVWTGSELIVFGGYTQDSGQAAVNIGKRYNPSTDSWANTTNAASARRDHTALWTGESMIVWGGRQSETNTENNTGERYNPINNTWTPISTTNAPTARRNHTAVWTGTEMIIFGGFYYFTGSSDVIGVNTGARYNPITNTWTSISTINAPTNRGNHTAVWTGSEMIVWGGRSSFNWSGTINNTGARYNPSTNTWTTISNNNSPPASETHTAIWTGSEMILNKSNYYYNPVTNTWSMMGGSNSLAGLGVWTGTKYLVWGAQGFGASYDITTNSWNRILFNSTRHTPVFGTPTWLGDRLMLNSNGAIAFVEPANLYHYAKP